MSIFLAMNCPKHVEVEQVVREQIRDFVIENLMMGLDTDQLDDTGSLMDLGILDSVGVLDLVGFIESTWEIDIADEELVRENLDSINNLVGLERRNRLLAGHDSRPSRLLPPAPCCEALSQNLPMNQ